MFAKDIFVKVYFTDTLLKLNCEALFCRFFYCKMSLFAIIERRQRVLPERGDKPLAFSVFKWNKLDTIDLRFLRDFYFTSILQLK